MRMRLNRGGGDNPRQGFGSKDLRLNKKNKNPPQVVSNQKKNIYAKTTFEWSEIFEFPGVAGAREQQPQHGTPAGPLKLRHQ